MKINVVCMFGYNFLKGSLCAEIHDFSGRHFDMAEMMHVEVSFWTFFYQISDFLMRFLAFCDDFLTFVKDICFNLLTKPIPFDAKRSDKGISPTNKGIRP